MTEEAPDRAAIIKKWWEDLKENRAARAKLRHAGSLQSALRQQATYDLANRLGAKLQDMPTIALIAAVLACVREDTPDISVARALGSPQEQPLCSGLRFERLIDAAEGDAQITAFRRTLALLSNCANVKNLASSLLQWNNPSWGERYRQKWLYDYFKADNPAQNPS